VKLLERLDNFMGSAIRFSEKDYFKYILLLLFLLFCSSIQIIDDFRVLGVLKDVYLTIVPLYLFIVMWKKAQFKLDINIIFIFLAIFSVISMLWSISMILTIKSSILLVGSTIIAIYIGKNYSKKEIFRILLLWFLLLTAINLVAVIFHIGDVYQVDEIRYTNAAKGIFKHRNTLGFYMTLGGSIALWNIIEFKRNMKLRRTCTAILIGSLILLYMSKSMTSMILAIGLFLLIYLTRNKKFNKILIYSILPILIISVYTITYQPDWFVNFLLSIGRNPTFTGRSFIWQGAIKAIEYKFISGFGFNAFWNTNPYTYYFILPAYEVIPVFAHNGYLDLMIDFGIIGTLVALSLFPIILNKIRKLTELKNFDNYKYVTYSLSYIVFILIYNLMESSIVKQGSTMYLLLIVFSNVIWTISKEQKV
jgi:exopolysaccharide production protein ExoQ